MASLGAFSNRLLRAALLDPSAYEEVERDRAALAPALAAVVLSSLAAGVGAGGAQGSSASVFALFSVIALCSWIGWAALIYHVGGRLMPEAQTQSSFTGLLRTIGFAAAPGLFQVFGAFPGMTGLVFSVSAVWMLAAMIVAVRQALDYRTTRHALAVCAVAWILAVALPLAISLAFTRPALS